MGMYTDDFWCICVGAARAYRAIIALFLASANLGLLLARMIKAQNGSSLRMIGASLFFVLGIAAIPQAKVICSCGLPLRAVDPV